MNKTPSSQYKIRFHDCDMFGHLNNARYLDYMITARQDHLTEFYDFDYNSYYKNKLGWVVSHHDIHYLRPAHYDEMITIQSSLLNVNEETLLVEIVMMNEQKTQLKALLRSTLTFINLATGQRTRHSPEFLGWASTLVEDEIDTAMPVHDRIKHLQALCKSLQH